MRASFQWPDAARTHRRGPQDGERGSVVTRVAPRPTQKGSESMSASSVLAGLAGVRRCIVIDGEKNVLERTGAPGDPQNVVDAAAGLTIELEKLGALLG